MKWNAEFDKLRRRVVSRQPDGTDGRLRTRRPQAGLAQPSTKKQSVDNGHRGCAIPTSERQLEQRPGRGGNGDTWSRRFGLQQPRLDVEMLPTVRGHRPWRKEVMQAEYSGFNCSCRITSSRRSWTKSGETNPSEGHTRGSCLLPLPFDSPWIAFTGKRSRPERQLLAVDSLP